MSGMLVAYRLAQAGVQVLVLEAGRPVLRNDALTNYRNAVIKSPEAPYPDTAYAPGQAFWIWKATMFRRGRNTLRALYVRRVGSITPGMAGTRSLRAQRFPHAFPLWRRRGSAA